MEIRVPDIGDFADVPVIEVHVAPGDVVDVEDPLITLESDKATMDVPSPVAGTIGQVRIAVGDQVSQGDVIIELQTGQEVAPAQAVDGQGRPTAESATLPPGGAEPGTGRPARKYHSAYSQEKRVTIRRWNAASKFAISSIMAPA